MEGAYNRISLARNNVPAESFALFMDSLMTALRLLEIGAHVDHFV